MNWFSTVIISICTAAVLGILLMGIEGSSGIFKCVRLVISLVLSLYVISVCLNTDFNFFDSIKAEEFKINDSRYSKGVLKSFNENLKKDVLMEIEKLYPNSGAEVYVVSEINEDYEINVINLSVNVSNGDISRIINLINKNCGIEKEKIIVQRE